MSWNRLAVVASLALLAGLLTGMPSRVQAEPAPARTHDITIEDYFTEAFVTDCAISPDGRYVAFAEMRWEPPAEKRNTDLWLTDARTSDTRRLTFDPAKDENPQWSPDSRWIYFTSNRGEKDDPAPLNGKTQVWRMSVDGGDPVAMTRLADGVDDYAISRDGRTLYYVVSNEVVQPEWKDLMSEYKDLTYGKGVENFSQVWKLDLSEWRAEKIIDDKRVIRSFAVSPDEKSIAMVTQPAAELIWGEGFSRVDIFDAATQKITALNDSLWRKVAKSPYGWIEGLAWSADSKNLAFRVDWDGYPAELYAAHWTAGGIQMHWLSRPQQLSLGEGTHMEWIGNSHDLTFMAEQKARVRVAVIADVQPGKQGGYRVLTPGDVVADNFSLTRDGKSCAIALADTTHPADIYVTATDSKSAPKRLTRVNPQIDSWKLPHIQIVKWQGANGDTVEGILELPHDYQPGQKLPLHVALHGGPTMADHLYFEYWIYGRGLWASLGWAVFAPNYHGSTGYGDKFLTDLIGREDDIEVEDILKGVDALVARGMADSSKLAVSGWSNGGFLTNCLITKTDRFKAASSGAGVVDMAIQWGTEDTPGHVVNYTQGLPWDRPDAYRKSSPLWELNKVKTPTLIHQGAADSRVPPAHSQTLFRGLSFYEHVPCELIEYPDQGHSLMTYSYRKAKLEWDVAWFDKYVLGKNTAEPKKP
jgi:dipeptidyl aminopeptidase/acylaminoacyl peptidase